MNSYTTDIHQKLLVHRFAKLFISVICNIISFQTEMHVWNFFLFLKHMVNRFSDESKGESCQESYKFTIVPLIFLV